LLAGLKGAKAPEVGAYFVCVMPAIVSRLIHLIVGWYRLSRELERFRKPLRLTDALLCIAAYLLSFTLPRAHRPPRAAAGYGLVELMSHVRWDNGPQGNSSENRTYPKFR
jgi:hypothetical protein